MLFWETVAFNLFDLLNPACYDNRYFMKKRKIVVIGGGTGTYTVLSGLKKFSNLDISAIVSMMDSGGSNRVIRDEFGLLPTSDIRQCMVALASGVSNKTLRDLFTYRYSHGTGIEGMTFGNLFMAALTDISGSQKKAIAETCELLGVTGSIIPVTYDDVHLLAKYENGAEVLGEHNIDEENKFNGKYKITNLSLVPLAKANRDGLNAIVESDFVILGPGDLYTSVICNLLLSGVKNAFKKTKAQVVYVMNIMTRNTQTSGFTAQDHTSEIEKYLGRMVDTIILNKSKIQPKALSWYNKFGMKPVVDDLRNGRRHNVVRKSVASSTFYKKSKGDKLTRSLIRHDPDKLAKAIVSLF